MKQKSKINVLKLFKLGILLLGVSFLFKNCETNEELKVSLDLENLENLNVKTVSFEDAKKFFNQENEEVKKERKLYASKNGTIPLELFPDWNTLKHDDLIGIEKAQLTLSDLAVNREGDYISKLFFININDKVETVIFTIYQKKVSDDGKILEATLYFNKLDGQFLDGYKIENGLLTKRLVVKKSDNVQKAGIFLLLQGNEPVYWCMDGEVFEVTLTFSGGGSSGGGSSGTSTVPNFYGITGGFLSYSGFYMGSPNIYFGGGAASYTSITSLAGTLYTQTLAEWETDCPEGYTEINGACVEEDIIESPANPIEDMEEFLKCFDKNKGATVTIYVDQPDPNNPDKDIVKGNVGHAFLSISQGNYTKSFGFYPASGIGYFSSTAGVMGNDQNHSSDVSVSIPISSQVLLILINHSISFSDNQYNLQSVNCTNFAISSANIIGFDVFLSECIGNYGVGQGATPGKFGEFIKNMSLPKDSTRKLGSQNSPIEKGC